MLEIALSPISYQSFSIRLENSNYDIRIYLCNNVMAIDITRDNVVLLVGMRLVSDFQIIPYRFMESGNFVLVTENSDYPDYLQFGVTQFLVYLTADEIAALPASN